MKTTLLTFSTLLCFCGLFGCSARPAQSTSHSKSAHSGALSENGSEAADSSDLTSIQLAAADVSERVPLKFAEPYPNRRDPFSPETSAAKSPAKADTPDEVVLRGFLNVDGPRALLMINGRSITAEEGQQYSGFSVVSIQPPEVLLQRGRNRWTVKLHP